LIPLPEEGAPPDVGLELRADCGRCLGLCCVAPAFAASADFAFDKPAGVACPHLGPDSRCGIHDRLRQEGMPGCVAYDCFGAGQHVAQVTMAGADWRESRESAERTFAVFAVMRGLHELAWHVVDALAMDAARPVHGDLRAALDGLEALTRKPAETLLAADVAGHRAAIGALLAKASALVRAEVEGGPRGRERDRRGADLAGADLAGADLRGQDLRGTNLRAALLIGADLRRANLRLADLAGADLRGADLRGADLRGALFVTRSQLEAAHGDLATRLSPARARPAHWQG
jgi:uncharacterized protein YjbI with pentapeptide repeats